MAPKDEKSSKGTLVPKKGTRSESAAAKQRAAADAPDVVSADVVVKEANAGVAKATLTPAKNAGLSSTRAVKALSVDAVKAKKSPPTVVKTMRGKPLTGDHSLLLKSADASSAEADNADSDAETQETSAQVKDASPVIVDETVLIDEQEHVAPHEESATLSTKSIDDDAGEESDDADAAKSKRNFREKMPATSSAAGMASAMSTLELQKFICDEITYTRRLLTDKLDGLSVRMDNVERTVQQMVPMMEQLLDRD